MGIEPMSRGSQGISPRSYNSIINKTPISYRANRMIGGKALSAYLTQLRTDPRVAITVDEQKTILESHLIPADKLRADSFDNFLSERKAKLLKLVADTMEKPVAAETPGQVLEPVEDEDELEEDDAVQ